MKKLLLKGGVFTILLAASVVSCKKDALSTNHRILTLDSSVPLIKNPNSILDYIENREDLDDQKVRKALYEMALASRDLFKNDKFNSDIILNARKKANDVYLLRDFISSNISRCTSAEKVIFENLSKIVSSSDLTHKSQNSSKNGDIEQYLPGIFLVNEKTADLSKLPLISSGVYVNSQLPGIDKFQDYLVVWYSDGKGGFNEILINESTAMNSTHPIFVFDNAEEAISLRVKSIIKYKNISSEKNQETAWYSSNEYKINHRFSNDLHSEFCLSGAQIDENGVINLICNNGSTFNT